MVRTLFAAWLVWGAVTGFALAQEKSVKPGVNDSFLNADPSQFVERFEKEGREVYDFRDKIIAACQLKPGMEVADVGAGTGLFTRMMSPLVGNDGTIFAIDITPGFVKHIEMSTREAGLKNVKGVICTPSSIEMPAESVDFAFICDTYHHFEFPYKTMRSVHNALRPNGELVLVEFHRQEGKSSEWVMGHVRAGKEVFVEEICRAGFKVVGEETFMKESYLVRFRKDSRLNSNGHTVDSPEVVKELVADQTAVIVDVREESEWNEGHLENARLLPLSQITELADNGDEAAKQALAAVLPKDRIIYLHCRSGGRCRSAANALKKLGYDLRPLELGYDDLVDQGFSMAD